MNEGGWTTGLTPLLAFAAVVLAIPAVLWLMRRAGYGRGGQPGLLRQVASLALSPSQRIVVIELARPEKSEWLVLALSGDRINHLTSMDAPTEPPGALAHPQARTVDELIDRWRLGSGQEPRT